MVDTNKEVIYIQKEFMAELYDECLCKMIKNDVTTYDLQKKEGVCTSLLGVPYSTFNRLRLASEGSFVSISEKQIYRIATKLGFVIQRTLVKKV